MDGERFIRIIHEPTEEEPFVVLDKPAGLPSAPLHEGDESAYTQAAARWPELQAVSGRKATEHGLVHRIDTATRGILLIAASQPCYDYLQHIQQQGLFIKQYRAECLCRPDCGALLGGFPPPPLRVQHDCLSATIESCFRPYGEHGKAVRPVTGQAGKAAQKKAAPLLYRTEISLRKEDGRWNALCSISRGYRHQVRCHLAWLGFPIQGDPLYSPDGAGEAGFSFTAESFSFPDAKSGIRQIFSIKSAAALD